MGNRMLRVPAVYATTDPRKNNPRIRVLVSIPCSLFVGTSTGWDCERDSCEKAKVIEEELLPGGDTALRRCSGTEARKQILPAEMTKEAVSIMTTPGAPK